MATPEEALQGMRDTFSAGVQAAGDGALTFDPTAAERCIQACGQTIDQLLQVLGQCQQFAHVTGMDGFVASKYLATNQLDPKGTPGDPRSIQHALQSQIDTAQKLMDLFVAAGKAFQQTEDGSKAQFIDLNAARDHALHK